MHNLPRLSSSESVLLVVDLQDRLLAAMPDALACTSAAARLIDAARVLDVPILLTEQYPAGLGRTCAAVRQALGDLAAIEKTRFSACVEAVTTRLEQLARRQVVVVGIETHVCVQQTVLGLLRMGREAWVCADAVSSRRMLDHEVALDRMRQAGAAVTTTESVIFEILGEAGGERFKRILRIVK